MCSVRVFSANYARVYAAGNNSGVKQSDVIGSKLEKRRCDCIEVRSEKSEDRKTALQHTRYVDKQSIIPRSPSAAIDQFATVHCNGR